MSDRPRGIRLLLAAFFSRAMRTRFAQRWLSPHLAPAQMWLYRLTRGRLQVSGILVPTLVLITTGAKSGLRRETPLMCWPDDGGTFLVAGSNWGQPQHPGWTANLIADPHAEVIYERRHMPVTAQLLAADEREKTWPRLEAQWPGYREYERTAGRNVRIFRLTPG
jgi:deazaflavin-dependent oxidoreductase (nitroreductase family)